MPRDLPHLALPVWSVPEKRRPRPGGSGFRRENRSQHGQTLVNEADALVSQLQQRVQTAPPGIDPKLVFKLRLHPKGNLDDAAVDQIGLRVLARGKDKAVVVFPDQGTL